MQPPSETPLPRGIRGILSSWWFKLALSAVLLSILFYASDFTQLRRAVLRADPAWLLLAFATYLVSQIVSALRWCWLARPLGFTESFGRFVIHYFSGMYLNLFAPSTVAGDIGRALFLAQGKSTRALAVTTVIADRGLGFVALVWIGALAVILLPDYPLPAVLRLAAWLAFPTMIAVWWWGPLLVVRFLPPGNRWRLLVERELEPYRKDTRLLIESFGLAAVFHVLQITSQIFIAWAINIAVPWSFFFIFVPIINIAGMLPITMSGVGIREAGYLFFLSTLMHVARHSAIALGFLSSAIVLMTGLTGAPVFLFLQKPPPQ